MLKTRVIPTLLFKEFGLVKGKSFDSWRRTGSAVQTIKVYNMRDVDELIFLDIDASLKKKSPDISSIIDLSDECSIPLTVGGGIKNEIDALSILHAGADKISINSAIYDDPLLISRIAGNFGSQCIVVSIDVKLAKDNYLCFSHSGTKLINKSPVEIAKQVESLGAGEILLTSIDRDGTMCGYDLNLIEAVSKSVSIPIIASGGAGSYQDFVDAVQKAGASAVAASSMFIFTEQTPLEAKKFMHKFGINTRI